MMEMVVEDEPALLLPQIVYEVSAEATVGVPQMVPLVEPIERPLGRAGLISNPLISPPVLMGCTSAMAVPFTNK